MGCNILTPADDRVFPSPQLKLETVTGVCTKKARGESFQRSSLMIKTLSHEDNRVEPWQFFLEHFFEPASTATQHGKTRPCLPTSNLRLGWMRRSRVLKRLDCYHPDTYVPSRQRGSEVWMASDQISWRHNIATLFPPKDTSLLNSSYLPCSLSYCLKANLCGVFASPHLFPLTACLRWM